MRIAARWTTGRLPFANPLDAVKFVCKDVPPGRERDRESTLGLASRAFSARAKGL